MPSSKALDLPLSALPPGLVEKLNATIEEARLSRSKKGRKEILAPVRQRLRAPAKEDKLGGWLIGIGVLAGIAGFLFSQAYFWLLCVGCICSSAYRTHLLEKHKRFDLGLVPAAADATDLLRSERALISYLRSDARDGEIDEKDGTILLLRRFCEEEHALIRSRRRSKGSIRVRSKASWRN